MLIDERIVSFINSYSGDEEEIIASIEQEALDNQVPIIRKETKEFIKVMLLALKPKRVLEVGTAVGFSSIYMSQYLPEGGNILTIEKDHQRYEKAIENIEKSKRQKLITVIEGDAAEELKKLEGKYDFIFMDAAKGQYINFLPDVLRLLDLNGTLLSDNVLQDGDVLESHYAVTKRNRTIHDRMREYLYILKHTKGLETAIIPLGDGVAISTRIGDFDE